MRTLLRYSREEPSEKQACSVNDVAKQALDSPGPTRSGMARNCVWNWIPTAPLTPMNPLEIELVLLNLIRNAVEAGDGEGDRDDPQPADRRRRAGGGER